MTDYTCVKNLDTFTAVKNLDTFTAVKNLDTFTCAADFVRSVSDYPDGALWFNYEQAGGHIVTIGA